MVSQNGSSCSRGLPESCVMMTLSRSTVRIRSRMTRYWLIGVSSESRCFAHSASQAFLIGGDLVLERGERLAAAALRWRLDLRDQRVDDQRGIADQAEIGA